MEKIRFRSDIAQGIKEGKSGIDKEKGVIKGFAVITKGEAKGHNMQIDDTMLNQVVELGNKSSVGIKSRFGHPNMSSDALGTHLGRIKNFTRDGDIVRGDLTLDKSSFTTPNGNLGKYVLDLAESDPAAFGASIVFSGKSENKPDIGPMGEKIYKKDKDGNDLPELARCEKLYAGDIVDEPAANSGFFSESVQPSAEMTAFLDKLLCRPDAVAKIQSFLNRYFENENQLEQKESNIMADLSKLTLEELKAGNPALVTALQAELKAASDKEIEALNVKNADALLNAVKAAKEETLTAERARIGEVIAEGKAFEAFGLSSVLHSCLKDGKDKVATLSILKEAHYNQMLASSNQAPGASKEGEKTSDFSNLPIDQRAQKEWETNQKLHEEFGEEGFESYKAFLKADKNNQVKIFSKK
ncbi:MAG: hypothetical protein WC373_04935 [Smithella sp.]